MSVTNKWSIKQPEALSYEPAYDPRKYHCNSSKIFYLFYQTHTWTGCSLPVNIYKTGFITKWMGLDSKLSSRPDIYASSNPNNFTDKSAPLRIKTRYIKVNKIKIISYTYYVTINHGRNSVCSSFKLTFNFNFEYPKLFLDCNFTR